MNPKTYPPAFIRNMRDLLGEEAEAFFDSQQQPPPVSIRLNPRKPAGFNLNTVPWCESGRLLPARPVFTQDPALHAGAYYVQEASSMFLSSLIAGAQATAVLDLCAAPGGKSTLLRSVLPDECLLVANETIRTRVPVLQENMAKWGHPAYVVTHNKPRDFAAFPGFFDIIVCDAPCSGEGLFRKDPDAVKQWSERAVNFCAARQRSIVEDVWPALKPGGVFIYSTCTFNRTENEDVLEWIKNSLGGSDHRFEGAVPEGVVAGDAGNMFRLYPHRVPGEGIFMGMLRKKGPVAVHAVRSYTRPAPEPDDAVLELLSAWVNEPGGFSFFTEGPEVYMIPKRHAAAVRTLGNLHIISAGTRVAVMKGPNLQPAPELALSIHLNRDAFPRVNLSLAEAMDYLRGGTSFPHDGEEGYCLMTWKDLPLGFSKKTAGRFNNLYPNGWYVRMPARIGMG